MDGTAGVLTQERLLVARAQVEPSAFAAVYDHYYPRVYTYLRYRVGEVEAAEDLTARVFERVLERIGDYRAERAPFAAWLFAIARNVVNDYVRFRRRHPALRLDEVEIASSEPLPEEALVRSQAHAGLLAALAGLSEREREIVALRFAAGLTNRRIAEMMDLSEKNVSVILYRAMQRLRERIEAQE